MVLGALAALALVVPRWRRGRGADEPADDRDDGDTPALSPTDARRLDDELARFEG